jgi:hypothetical protein
MANRHFVICVRNDGYAASLEIRKVYERIPDALAESRGQVRVIDETGDDYLFPTDYFKPIELSREAETAFELP